MNKTLLWDNEWMALKTHIQIFLKLCVKNGNKFDCSDNESLNQAWIKVKYDITRYS